MSVTFHPSMPKLLYSYVLLLYRQQIATRHLPAAAAVLAPCLHQHRHISSSTARYSDQEELEEEGSDEQQVVDNIDGVRLNVRGRKLKDIPVATSIQYMESEGELAIRTLDLRY